MNWLDITLIILAIICIIGGIVSLVLMWVDGERAFGILTIVSCVFISFICIALFLIRLDFADGSATGVVTTVDGTMFGNKYVYIKTSENYEEKHCVDKNNEELMDTINDFVGERVKVTYGKMVGFYSTGDCPQAPIETIEIIKGEK